MQTEWQAVDAAWQRIQRRRSDGEDPHPHDLPRERGGDPTDSSAAEKPAKDRYRPPKAGMRHLLVRNVPEDLREALHTEAEHDRRVLNEEVIVALQEWIAARRRQRGRQMTSSPP